VIQYLSEKQGAKMTQLSDLHYNPMTGVFTRLVSGGNKRAGSPAGWLRTDGYIGLRVGGKNCLAHRIAWQKAYGKPPVGDIDHRNGVKNDNRIQNLRDVSTEENCQNRRLPVQTKNRTSRFLGVSFHKRVGKYVAQISVSGKKIHIGYYATEELAYQAYLTAKRKLHAGCLI
jgi:hypothetical protein